MIVKEWEGEPLNLTLRNSDSHAVELLNTLPLIKDSGADYRIWVGYDGDKTIGIGGVIKYQDTAEVFLILSDDALKQRFSFHRHSKRLFKKAVFELQLTKILTYVDVAYPDRNRWAETFGFKYTGITIELFNKAWSIFQWERS